MKRATKKRFPGYAGTYVTEGALAQLDEIAARETEGNRSMAFRRAILEYIARHKNGEHCPSPFPAP